MMKVACIVPSAGKGKRLGLKADKPFILFGKKPLLFYTLRALSSAKCIDYIVVVVSRARISACERLVKKYRLKKVRFVVPGGLKRYNSVKNALPFTNDADFVLIHDGARPFIKKDKVKSVLKAAKKYGASCLATPAKQTLKTVGKAGFILDTPKRKFIWEAQTPQCFKRGLLLRAYKRINGKDITDDSSLVEKIGKKIKIVKGSYNNIKITTPEDVELAKRLLRKNRRI